MNESVPGFANHRCKRGGRVRDERTCQDPIDAQEVGGSQHRAQVERVWEPAEEQIE